MSQNPNRETVLQFYQAFDDRDIDLAFALLADDFIKNLYPRVFLLLELLHRLKEDKNPYQICHYKEFFFGYFFGKYSSKSIIFSKYFS